MQTLEFALENVGICTECLCSRAMAKVTTMYIPRMRIVHQTTLSMPSSNMHTLSYLLLLGAWCMQCSMHRTSSCSATSIKLAFALLFWLNPMHKASIWLNNYGSMLYIMAQCCTLWLNIVTSSMIMAQCCASMAGSMLSDINIMVQCCASCIKMTQFGSTICIIIIMAQCCVSGINSIAQCCASGISVAVQSLTVRCCASIAQWCASCRHQYDLMLCISHWYGSSTVHQALL